MALVFTVRQLVESNLSWFHGTRAGHEAGRERAVNINREVMHRWFRPDDMEGVNEIRVITTYFRSGPRRLLREFAQDDPNDPQPRAIRLQGGGKNWRLAGKAIEGAYYGTLRTGDLLLMVFDTDSRNLRWTCVRQGGGAARGVPPEEASAHADILGLTGAFNAGDSMWILDSGTALRVIDVIKDIHPGAADLLLDLRLASQAVQEALSATKLRVSDDLMQRLVGLLLAKRFLILTGLSGSGKTGIARTLAFVTGDDPSRVALVPVGADWTNRDRLLGYRDALRSDHYVRTQTLDLILRARSDSNHLYFLILDEMNLSQVERYFADFLSTMESGGPITLHDSNEEINDVPNEIHLPDNLVVVGTVNVDETTHMFSPKVLDRAGVIEFRVSRAAMGAFLREGAPRLSATPTGNDALGGALLRHARMTMEPDAQLSQEIETELMPFFDALAPYGAEFAFRPALEMVRFARFHKLLLGANWQLQSSVDAAIMQKILPRMNGSARHLAPLLNTLGRLCYYEAPEDRTNGGINLFTLAVEGARMPLSFDKIVRMLARLEQNGFAAFAEG